MYRNLWRVLLLLVVLPFPAGCLWMGRDRKGAARVRGAQNRDGNIVRAYLYGLFTMLTVYQVFAIPMSYQKGRLAVLNRWWLAVMLVLAAAGTIRSGFFRAQRQWLKNLRKKITPVLVVAVACMVLQAGYVSEMQHVDEDDAYYLGTAVTTVSTGRLYKKDSYTGKTMKREPLARYALASWPVFLATLSSLSGIQAVVLAHMILPAFTVLWVYLIYALTGAWIFPGDRHRQGWFLLFTVLLFSFSGYSVYSAQVFPLIRGWQGKAVLCGAGLPAVFYGCLRVYGTRRSPAEADDPAQSAGTSDAAVTSEPVQSAERPASPDLWNDCLTQLLFTVGFCTCLTTIGAALCLIMIAAFAFCDMIFPPSFARGFRPSPVCAAEKTKAPESVKVSHLSPERGTEETRDARRRIRVYRLRILWQSIVVCLPALAVGCVYLVKK